MTDAIGLIGVSLVVSAYFLIQTERVTTKDLSYSVYNLVGSLLIIYTLTKNFNFASLTIEAFWVAISVFGIARYLLRRRRNAGE